MTLIHMKILLVFMWKLLNKITIRRISRFFYIGKIGYKEECDTDVFSLENYALMIRCKCGGFLRWHFNAFVAKFCSSSSPKCTLITLSPLPPLSPFQRKRTNLLSVGPNLHISGWSLMLLLDLFCNICLTLHVSDTVGGWLLVIFENCKSKSKSISFWRKKM